MKKIEEKCNTPLIELQQKNSIVLECLDFTELNHDQSENIVEQISMVASDGFGKNMTPDIIARRLNKEPYVILAKEGNQLVGFLFSSINQTESEKYLYFSRAVKKENQGSGIGKMLLIEAIRKYQPTIIGAKSQNPAAIYSFIKAMKNLDISSIYPFFSDKEKNNMKKVILEFANTLGVTGNFDFLTGLISNSYGGRLGDYEVKLEKK
jgi:hypothetical protein